MDGGEYGSESGERIVEDSPVFKKGQMNFPQKHSSRAMELHRARRDIGRYKKSRRAAESVKKEAEKELSEAKNVVKNLKSLIEESNSRVNSPVQGFGKPNKPTGLEEQASVFRNSERYQYEEVMRELELVKQEVSKLKLDMASVLKKKTQAEKETKSLNSRIHSYANSAEALRREIEEVNEEQVLVELAHMEALKEHKEIEAQREKEVTEFSLKVGETRKEIDDISKEVEKSKEMEDKLTETLSDVDVLQNQLQLIRFVDNRSPTGNGLQNLHDGSEREEAEPASPLLQSVTADLEAAKKELALIKEEGFQFMTSMDIIRNEYKHVKDETARLQKKEEKTEATVQNLNSKLLRAKSKLENAISSEEKAQSIVSNLLLTHGQLKREAEAAKKEKQLISEETTLIKAEIEKTENETNLAEERLQLAMQELEAVKSGEALALEKLRGLIENAMRERAYASQHSPFITISKFEYEYLMGRAMRAEELADQKVAAAQAWIEALKANEKEILMKSELAHREVTEMRVEEEQQVFCTERSLSAKKRVEGELRTWGQKREKNSESEIYQLTIPRKLPREPSPIAGNPYLSQSRKPKFQKSASPGNRNTSRSSSITLKRRTKVIPNFTKMFTRKTKAF